MSDFTAIRWTKIHEEKNNEALKRVYKFID